MFSFTLATDLGRSIFNEAKRLRVTPIVISKLEDMVNYIGSNTEISHI